LEIHDEARISEIKGLNTNATNAGVGKLCQYCTGKGYAKSALTHDTKDCRIKGRDAKKKKDKKEKSQN